MTTAGVQKILGRIFGAIGNSLALTGLAIGCSIFAAAVSQRLEAQLEDYGYYLLSPVLDWLGPHVQLLAGLIT